MSIACEAKTNPMPSEIAGASRVRERLVALLAHLKTVHTNDVRAKALVKLIENIRVGVGASHSETVEYSTETGCMLVSFGNQTSNEGDVLGKVILALTKAASGNATCAADFHSFLLRATTEHLSWPVALGCDACLSKGVCFRAACPKCKWLDNAPNGCHARRYSWPELVGQPVTVAAEILRRQNPGTRVKTVPRDVLYHDPATPGDIRVVYDVRTGRVSLPPPHLSTLPEPTGRKDETCFLPGEGLCLGAPRPPPPKEWFDALHGTKIHPATTTLKDTHPGAAIEIIPRYAAVSDNLRHDRIRAWVDPTDATMHGSPSIG